MLEHIRADYHRVASTHQQRSTLRRIFYCLTNYGFLAILVYRYGRYARNIKTPVVGSLLSLIYFVLKIVIEILFGIAIDVNSEIGPGFYIGHFSCIIVTGNLGRNCSIGQGVTIGSKGAGKSDGWPDIGDNVYIGAGAKIIGNIRVGNNVVVGANAVVVKDVEDDMLVVGVPAKAIRKNA